MERYGEREKERMSTLNSAGYRTYKAVLSKETERERKVSVIFPKRFLFVILSLGIA